MNRNAQICLRTPVEVSPEESYPLQERINSKLIAKQVILRESLMDGCL
jgi:hypothetical protein